MRVKRNRITYFIQNKEIRLIKTLGDYDNPYLRQNFDVDNAVMCCHLCPHFTLFPLLQEDGGRSFLLHLLLTWVGGAREADIR